MNEHIQPVVEVEAEAGNGLPTASDIANVNLDKFERRVAANEDEVEVAIVQTNEDLGQ